MHESSIIGYLVSGGLAAVANYGSRLLFSHWLSYEAAVVAAYGVGMITAFVLMRRLAFRAPSSSTHSQAIGFCLVNLIGVLQTVAVSSLLARWLLPALGFAGNHEAIAHAIGVVIPVLSSYFGHRYLTFR